MKGIKRDLLIFPLCGKLLAKSRDVDTHTECISCPSYMYTDIEIYKLFCISYSYIEDVPDEKHFLRDAVQVLQDLKLSVMSCVNN